MSIKYKVFTSAPTSPTSIESLLYKKLLGFSLVKAFYAMSTSHILFAYFVVAASTHTFFYFFPEAICCLYLPVLLFCSIGVFYMQIEFSSILIGFLIGYICMYVRIYKNMCLCADINKYFIANIHIYVCRCIFIDLYSSYSTPEEHTYL